MTSGVLTAAAGGRSVDDMIGGLGARGGLTASSTLVPLLLVRRVREWPVASQHQARRNAMLAATACASRRAERQDVADYLAALTREAAPAPLTAPLTEPLTEPLTHRHAARG